MAEIEAIAADASINHAIFSKAIRSVTLKFENVEFIIKKKREGRMINQMKKDEKTEDKVILKGIDGIVFPGEMLAMLGPSGSGKTTLLTALGGRLSGCLTGDITYNGKPFLNVVKRNTGFVTQDDVFYPHLTVTESLVFTALLRLPNSLTKDEKISHVADVIAQLGLTKCKDSIIGDNRVRGVSGGERKRVSIGQEMLINPSLLLLDEPTSGLDSTTAQRIVSTIRELANGGRTIVMTIHQPSSRLYYMFHKVLLLSEGNQLYFGKTNDAMNYFAAIGFVPLFTMNPADFLLDLANGISQDNSQEDQALVKQTLVTSYKTNLSTKVKEELQQQQPNHDKRQDVSNVDKQSTKWNTTWWQQFSVLLRRGLKERKHESFSGLNIGQVLTVSFLAGLLWWRSDISHLQDQANRAFLFLYWILGFYIMLGAIFTFPSERAMLEKERASGMYRLSSYFLARTIGDLPLLLILPVVFVTITYWMAGLKARAENYVLTVLTVLLSVVVTEGMGLAIGAVCMDLKKASTLGSVLMLSFLLAGGFYVQNIPRFMSWIKYVSIANHSYRLLLLSQYKNGETYKCGTDNICLVEDYPSIKSIGLNGAPISVTALFIMLVFYRLVAYGALMRTGVTKK